jgi:hypothetical protein
MDHYCKFGANTLSRVSSQTFPKKSTMWKTGHTKACSSRAVRQETRARAVGES